MSGRTRLRKACSRALVMATACGVTAALLVAMPVQQLPAQAADLRAFDAGYIISDALFYDSHAMSAAGIQQFLNAKGGNCDASAGTCLKNFVQTTVTRPADTRCTGTYTGVRNETAAQIIAKVAVSCGINPQALLVMLQKEQSLVTATAGGTAAQYKWAMGYGCPDTAPCDAQYPGFFNQVYMAAHQYQNYAKSPSSFGHRAGIVNHVLYSPNAACGASGVLIQNQATASLYNYTPYQPNAAALAAGYGEGDSCSAYGNRNFWSYFTDWFGPTTQRPPFGSLDAVTVSSPASIRVRGWALDPDTVDSIRVHVYVDGKLTTGFAATSARSDIGRIFRRGNYHGFDASVTTTGGTHEVCVYAIDSAGGSNPRIGCGTVVVTNHAPIGSLDAVTSSEGHILARGWALDPDTMDSIRVHVYVDGKLTTGFAASGARSDIGRIFGRGDYHGFSGTVNGLSGTHQVCVYGIDSAGGSNPRIGCGTVVVTNHAPIGFLDAVTSSEGHILARGWALDPDTMAPITVHVYVDGKLTTGFAASGARSDIGRIFGRGDNHGFSGTVNALSGTHQVCVYGIDSAGGSNPRIGCRTVVITNATPIGALETLTTAGMETFTMRGWALDPDTSDPIAVKVSVDGNPVPAPLANQPRPDVGVRYGKGDNHGFIATMAASYGNRTVCITAVDSWGGANAKPVCSTAEVNGYAFGQLDSVVATSGKITVRGWALDPNTSDPIKVHVRTSGMAVQALTANTYRPDVGRIFGKGDNHGFSGTLNALPGTRSVCVYAIDSAKGSNPLIRCTSVTVP